MEEYIVSFSPVSEPAESKTFPKTCMICFKTFTSKGEKDLFELWFADSEQITLLEKMQAFLYEKLWINECTVLCSSCMKDLNEAFDFRKRLLKAQEIWKTTFLSIPTCNLSNQQRLQKVDSRPVGEESNQTINNITNPIGSYEIELDAEHLKAAYLASNSLCYFSCKNCDAVFTNSTEFTAHKCEENTLRENLSVVVNGESEGESEPKISGFTVKKKQKSFKCDLCGKIFKDVTGKNKHKIKVHFREKIFPCTFCNKSFKQNYHLKEHLTSHTGEKNYLCSICDKTFQRISSQRRHMRTHEKAPGKKVKQTPFLCTICGKNFPYSSGVQRHMRTHTGERKYECKFCSRKFMQSTHLQVHLRTHTGEKPYMCNYCGKSFPLKSVLQKHIANAHNAEKN